MQKVQILNDASVYLLELHNFIAPLTEYVFRRNEKKAELLLSLRSVGHLVLQIQIRG